MTKKPVKKSAPNGRPSLYRPEYCQMLIDHMATGMTYESFAGVVSVDRDTLYQWEEVHKEFSDTKRVARAKQQLANEKRMHDMSLGKIRNASVTAQIFIMKNCHKWTDRVEHTERSVKGMTDEELEAEARALLDARKEKERQ